MPILPYCVLLTKVLGELPATGLLDERVQTETHGELAVVFSELEKSRITSQNFQQAALEFHRVVHSLFEHAAVIPFRFPTWLSAGELRAHVETESTRYQAFLTGHQDHVQMEMRVTQSSAGASERPAASGTEHLRIRAAQLHKLERAVEELKYLLSAEVLAWRQRDTPEGKRLYALVERRHVPSFREKLSNHAMRCSGPWPATEFLNPD